VAADEIEHGKAAVVADTTLCALDV
jgi:hypothetical protein